MSAFSCTEQKNPNESKTQTSIKLCAGKSKQIFLSQTVDLEYKIQQIQLLSVEPASH